MRELLIFIAGSHDLQSGISAHHLETDHDNASVQIAVFGGACKEHACNEEKV